MKRGQQKVQRPRGSKYFGKSLKLKQVQWVYSGERWGWRQWPDQAEQWIVLKIWPSAWEYRQATDLVSWLTSFWIGQKQSMQSQPCHLKRRQCITLHLQKMSYKHTSHSGNNKTLTVAWWVTTVTQSLPHFQHCWISTWFQIIVEKRKSMAVTSLSRWQMDSVFCRPQPGSISWLHISCWTRRPTLKTSF